MRLAALTLVLAAAAGCAPSPRLADGGTRDLEGPAPSSCKDRTRNGQETDVDCGGPFCQPCGAGLGCSGPGDCQSALCLNGRCLGPEPDQGAPPDLATADLATPPAGSDLATPAASDLATPAASDLAIVPACMDGRKDGAETDVDCGGGSCSPCAVGKVCQGNGDCMSGTCIGDTCRAAPTCDDQIQNGNETDVDCGGGTCAPCALGKRCNGNADCKANLCLGGLCVAQPTCNDGLRNQDETDVDCGGQTCPHCTVGKRCNGNSDCQTNLCSGGLCAAQPTCNDNIRNQDETDVDCGGQTCGPCADGKACLQNSDCVAMYCGNHVCSSGAQILVDTLSNPYNLALDATSIYWVENRVNGGALKKVAKNGGNPVTLSPNLSEPTAVVVDGSYAYVLERNGGSNGMIHRVPINGGNTELVVGGLSNSQNNLVQWGQNLYWGDYVQNMGGVIRTAPKGSNVAATVVASGNGLLNLRTALDTDGSYLYIANDSNVMLRFPINGGNPAMLGSAMNVSAVRVSGGTVFFTDYSDNIVGSLSANGGPTTTLANGGNGLANLVVDGSYVYYIDSNNPGSVRRVGINGGQVKTYSNQSGSLGIGVDVDYVYWVTYVFQGQGKVMRAPK